LEKINLVELIAGQKVLMPDKIRKKKKSRQIDRWAKSSDA
jgi:hypothetical protein